MQALGIGSRLPPTFVSVSSDAVDAEELSALLAATRQNCLQFPLVHSDGSLVHAVQPSKLRLALKHSTVVVSIHMRGPIPEGDYMVREQDLQPSPVLSLGSLSFFGRRLSTSPRLIAFGRATSDCSLTASIHDLAVAPSLQRRGFGRQILQRLVRELRRRGIADIAALVPSEKRPFFAACGFADDELKSTTMLYLRSNSASSEVDSVRQLGRKYLFVPSALASKPVRENRDRERG